MSDSGGNSGVSSVGNALVSPVGQGIPANQSISDHFNDDLDLDPNSHHHTLGVGPNQAARGNHTHTATSTSLIFLDALIKQGPAGIANDVFPAGLRVPQTFQATGVFLRSNRSHGPVGSACTVAVYSVAAAAVIFTVNIAAGQIYGSVDYTSSPVTLTAGDYLYFNITSVGSTTPVWDVAVQIVGAPYTPDPTTTVTPSLLWRLNESSGTVALDSSGNGYNGTYFGTPGFGQPSLLASGAGSSVLFSGDDRVELAHAAWMDASAISFDAFIKTSATLSPVWDRDVYGSAGNVDRIWMSRTSSTGKFEVLTFDGSGGVAATATSLTTVNNNVKHHVGCTMDRTNIKLYIDGTLEATVAAASPVYAGGEAAYLGLGVNRSGGSGSIAATFVGTIDEAAYFAGVALTATQMAARAAQ